MSALSKVHLSDILPRLAVALSILATVLLASPSFAATPMAMSKLTPKSAAFHDAMRKLWDDHVFWTRLYIIDEAAGLASKSTTTERLLKNQDDIGDAIKPYYGEEAGQKLEKLLTEHIKIAVEVVEASKKGDQIKAGDAATRWFANADEIGSFLAAANPKNWPEAEMKKHMRKHLDLTSEEATAYLKADWGASILAFDKARDQILDMADMLSDGIVKQFPAKF